MSPRVERQKPAAPTPDAEPEPAARPAAKKPRLEPAPLSALGKRVLPSPFFTYQKPGAARRSEATCRDVVTAPAKRADPMMSALEPAAPVAVRFEAGKRLEALEAKHDQVKSVLEHSIAHWTEVAASLRKSASEDARRGVFREGLDGAVWHAVRQASVARALLRDLKADFDAAKFAYDALLGRATGPAARQGSAERPPVVGETGSTAERFAQRLARYDRSLDAVRSSGVLAPIVAAAMGVAAGINGRGLDLDDYRILDGIYQAGQVANVPLGVRIERGALARGAASPGPGIDHRDAAKDLGRDNLVRARQYSTYDK